MRRMVIKNAMFEIGFVCETLGKTKLHRLPYMSLASSTTCMARFDKGTKCRRFPFMREAGISHNATSRSNSYQRARRTSFVRVAVRIRNKASRKLRLPQMT